jgi:phosphate/sulfate permease
MTKQPRHVTILIMTVLTFTVLNGVRLYETILNWDLLIIYNAQPGPIYMAALSLAWILASLLILFTLIKGYPRSSLYMNLASILFACWYWLDRTLLQYGQRPTTIPLVGTVFMLLFIFLLTRPDYHHPFYKQRDLHDR